MNAKVKSCAVAAGFAVFLSTFCFFQAPSWASGPQQIEAIDGLGRKIIVPAPVRKIVALNSDALEALRILNAQDRVVGVFSQIETDSAFWGDLVNKPKVGSWREPNSEIIAELAPDIVLAYAKTPSPEWEARMTSQGITVLRLDLYKAETLEREIRALGRVLGRTQEAERFCSWNSQWMNRIESEISGAPQRPWVYVESYSDYQAAAPTSGGHEMVVMAGGRNIAEDLAIPFARITPEWVVTRNPEVIIKAGSFSSGYGAADAVAPLNKRRDGIMNRPAWSLIKAVATGNVHVLDSSIWVGPRAVVGIAYMAKWLHPDLMSDIDPEALHKEYMETFQRLPYKGAYVSDPAPEASGK